MNLYKTDQKQDWSQIHPKLNGSGEKHRSCVENKYVISIKSYILNIGFDANFLKKLQNLRQT